MKTPTLYFLVQPELAECHDGVSKRLNVASEDHLFIVSVTPCLSNIVHGILTHSTKQEL